MAAAGGGGGGGDTPDAEVKPSKPSSEMLQGLFKELQAICAFVAEHLTSAEGEERRRYAVAAQATHPLPTYHSILPNYSITTYYLSTNLSHHLTLPLTPL